MLASLHDMPRDVHVHGCERHRWQIYHFFPNPEEAEAPLLDACDAMGSFDNLLGPGAWWQEDDD